MSEGRIIRLHKNGNGAPVPFGVNDMPSTMKWGMEEGRRWLKTNRVGPLMRGKEGFNGKILLEVITFSAARLSQVEYETAERDGAAFATGVMLAVIEREINQAKERKEKGLG